MENQSRESGKSSDPDCLGEFDMALNEPDLVQSVRGVLQKVGVNLSQYADSFEAWGYDDVNSLKSLSSAEVEDMLDTIGMEMPGHRLRFTKWHESQKNLRATLEIFVPPPAPQFQAGYDLPTCAQETEVLPYSAQHDTEVRYDNCLGFPYCHGQLQIQNTENFNSYISGWAHQWNLARAVSDNWNRPAPAQWNGLEWVSNISLRNDYAGYIKTAKDRNGTHIIQNMLLEDSNEDVLRAVSLNLSELSLNLNGVFVVKASFLLNVREDLPVSGQLFEAAVCDLVTNNWYTLVFGRMSTFSYKLVMWWIEFCYIKGHDSTLLTCCQTALDNAGQMIESNYGHLVLQHILLFLQKSLCKCNPETQDSLLEIRDGFFLIVLQGLRNKNEWQKRSNNASHFINKYIDMIVSDFQFGGFNEDVLATQSHAIVQTVLDDDDLVGVMANNLSGQYTARRIYDLATPKERKVLERHAQAHGARIDKPEKRNLEKFSASLFMPEEETALDFSHFVKIPADVVQEPAITFSPLVADPKEDDLGCEAAPNQEDVLEDRKSADEDNCVENEVPGDLLVDNEVDDEVNPYCEVCGGSINSKIQEAEHRRGRKHRRNLAKLLEEKGQKTSAGASSSSVAFKKQTGNEKELAVATVKTKPRTEHVNHIIEIWPPPSKNPNSASRKKIQWIGSNATTPGRSAGASEGKSPCKTRSNEQSSWDQSDRTTAIPTSWTQSGWVDWSSNAASSR